MTTTRPEPIRAAIVGTGHIAYAAIMPALRDCADEVDVVAAVDINAAQLPRFADDWEIEARYHSLAVMLAERQPDLVVLATPPGVHGEQVVQVLEAGAWAWCEKPPALSLADYDTIVGAERPGGPYAPIVFQHRFGSGARHAAHLMSSGALGRPLVAHCQTTWWRGREYFASSWRGSFTGDGGPNLALGIHQIDLLIMLLGPWQEVHAWTGHLVHDIETGDACTAIVRFGNGALATVVTSAVSARETSHLRIDTELATVELNHLYGYGNDDWTYHAAPGVDTATEAGWVNELTDQRSSHLSQLRRLLADLRAGRRPQTSGPGGRAALELVTAMYKDRKSVV